MTQSLYEEIIAAVSRGAHAPAKVLRAPYSATSPLPSLRDLSGPRSLLAGPVRPPQISRTSRLFLPSSSRPMPGAVFGWQLLNNILQARGRAGRLGARFEADTGTSPADWLGA